MLTRIYLIYVAYFFSFSFFFPFFTQKADRRHVRSTIIELEERSIFIFLFCHANDTDGYEAFIYVALRLMDTLRGFVVVRNAPRKLEVLI